MVQYLIYVIGWFAVPVVVLEIGRWLKRSEAMPSYITVYNWFQLIHLPFPSPSGRLRSQHAMRIGGLIA